MSNRRGRITHVVSTFLALLAIPIVRACDTNYSIPFGNVSSPGFPLNYPSYQNCRTVITAPENTRILIVFDTLNLENSWCSNDYIKIYPIVTNGQDDTITLCGTARPSLITSKTNYINIEFHSDQSVEYQGFFLFWKFSYQYIYHEEQLTWPEAEQQCSKEGGALARLDDISLSQIRSLWRTNNVTEAWSDSYFSPWIWVKGCLREPFISKNDNTVVFKANQVASCANLCRNSHYFGMKDNTCVCMEWFNGDFLKPDEHCTSPCPGNSNENCGGRSAMTVYMSDICYENSTTWLGTVSQTMDGERCKPWAEAYSASWDSHFPDGTVQNASNYCRDPDAYGLLWCYNKKMQFKFCDVPKCFEKDTPDQTPSKCMEFLYINKTTLTRQIPCDSLRSYLYMTGSMPMYSRYSYDWPNAWTRLTNHIISTAFQPPHLQGTFWRGFTRIQSHLSYVYSSGTLPIDCFQMHVNVDTGTLSESPVKCNLSRPYICQQAASTCGEALTSANGTFTSPNYPSKYTEFLNCIWIITVMPGYYIQLYFDMDVEQSLECKRDFIQVIDGNYTTGDLLTTKCGQHNWTIESSTHHVTVNFRSDMSVSNKGFQADWLAVPLPTTTREPDQSSTTNNYNETFRADKQEKSDSIDVWIYVAIAVGAAALLLLFLLFFLNRRLKTRRQISSAKKRGTSNAIYSVNYAITTFPVNPPTENPQPDADMTGTSTTALVDSDDIYINSMEESDKSNTASGKGVGDAEDVYMNTLQRPGKDVGAVHTGNNDRETSALSENIYTQADDGCNSLSLPGDDSSTRSSASHVYHTVEPSSRQCSQVSVDSIYSRVQREKPNHKIQDNARDNHTPADGDKTTYHDTPTYGNTQDTSTDNDNHTHSRDRKIKTADTSTYDSTHSYNQKGVQPDHNGETYNHLGGESAYDISYSGSAKEKQYKDPTYNTLANTTRDLEN